MLVFESEDDVFSVVVDFIVLADRSDEDLQRLLGDDRYLCTNVPPTATCCRPCRTVRPNSWRGCYLARYRSLITSPLGSIPSGGDPLSPLGQQFNISQQLIGFRHRDVLRSRLIVPG